MNEIKFARPTVLQELGRVIFSRFDQIIGNFTNDQAKNLSSQTSVSLGSESERFKIWAVELGLLVPGHGSLDYRVREAENLRSTLEIFLNDLSQYLKEVLDIVLSTTLENEAFIGSEFQIHTSPQSRQGQPCDDSFDDSDDDDMDSQAYIDILVVSITDVLDRLFKLSTKIRNPSTRLAASKAQSYRNIDHETDVDLINAFEHYDYDYVASMFHNYYKQCPPAVREANASACINSDNEIELSDHKDNCSLCQTREAVSENELCGPSHEEQCSTSGSSHTGTSAEEYPRLADFLIHRIARANVQRRKHFGYWRHHQSKLRQHTEIALQKEKLANAQAAPPVLEIFNRNPQEAQKIHLENENPLTAPTITTATRLHPALVVQQDAESRVSVSEYAPSSYSPDRESFDFPPPPKIGPRERFFECPYCFTICSRQFLSERAWRAHLIHDLRPYICTYQDCQTSDQLYDTRRDWIEHENAIHRKQWRCPDHFEALFPSKEGLIQHIHAQHSDKVDTMRSEAYLRSCESFSANAERPCPICFSSSVHATALNNHIALHLERFSIFALPRSTGDAAFEEKGADSVAAIGTTGSSRDQDLATIDDSADEWDTLLMNATAEGDNDRVSYILQDAFDPRSLDNASFEKKASVITSAIELAAMNDSLDILRTFLPDWKLQCAPEVNIHSVIAPSADNIEAVKLLLESGADIQRFYFDGTTRVTGLMAAAQSGRTEVIELLESYGARLDVTNADGDSALSLASAKGHVEAVRVLLALGEKLGTKNNIESAKSPIVEAAANGHVEVVRLLFQHEVQVNASMSNIEAALIAAISSGAHQCVRLLLAHVSDIDFVAPFNTEHCVESDEHSLTTALIEAVSNDYVGIVQMLLDRGANVQASDGYCTPLIAASYSSSETIVLGLLQQGADINQTTIREPYTCSALWAASCTGRESIVQILLRKGADPNLDGKSCALTAASRNGYANIVNILVRAGANVNIEGETLLTPLQSASTSGSIESVMILLNAGADPNLVHNSGPAALMLAAQNEFDEIVQVLLSRGADLNFPGGGNTGSDETESEDAQPAELNQRITNQEMPIQTWPSTKRCETAVEEVIFSPDGKWLAAAATNKVQIFNTGDGNLASSLETHQSRETWIHSVCFSPDCQLLVTGAEDGRLRVYETNTWKLKFVRQGHEDLIFSVYISSDSRTAASGSVDNTIKLWDLVGCSQIRVIQCGNHIYSLAFSPDSRFLAVGSSEKDVLLFDCGNGSLLSRLSGHQDGTNSVAFSPSGLELFSGSYDGTVKLFRISPEKYESNRCIRTMKGPKGPVISISPLHSTRWVVAASVDKTVRIWDYESGEPQCIIRTHGGWVSSVASCPTRRLIATGSDDKTITIWQYDAIE